MLALSPAYDVAQWETFFLGMVGATAALTGLLFVAIASNVERLLESRGLTDRAAETLAALLFLLAISALALAPQPNWVLGIEVAATAIALQVVMVFVQLRGLREYPDVPVHWYVSRIAPTTVATVPAFVAGVSLIAGTGGGFYWLAAATMLGIAGVAYGAWVLMIEILR